MEYQKARFAAAGLTAAVVAAFNAGAAWSENLALLIGNSTYAHTENARDAGTVFRLADALEQAGYRVEAAENTRRDDLRGRRPSG